MNPRVQPARLRGAARPRGSRRLLGTAIVAALTVVLTMISGPSTESASAAACGSSDVICDQFTRTRTTGWGSANRGGSWTASAAARLSVDGEAGLIASPTPGRTSIVTLPTAAPRDSRSTLDARVVALPKSGSGVYLGTAARMGKIGGYAARLRVAPGGATDVEILRLSTLTSGTVVATRRMPAASRIGTRIRLAFEVSGTTTVTLAAKAWTVGAAEPSSWTVSTTDKSSTRVQAAGTTAITMYSSASGDAPRIAVEALTVRARKTTSATTAPAPVPVPAPLPRVTRGVPGATAPGKISYTVPSGAVHVAKTGSDANPGTVTRPVRTITAALKVVRNGGVIVVHKGSYHEEVLIPPQKRVTIQPAPKEAVWLDGARAVTGWYSSGATWVVNNWKVALNSGPTYKKDAPDSTVPGWSFVDPAHPVAAHPDQVWVGGKQLKEISSRSRVKTGTFFVDGAKSQLVIGTNPAGGTVEASTLTQAVSIRSAGSVLRGIGVRRYATSVYQMGSVVVAAADVTVSNVTIRDNSTTGLYTWSPRTTLDHVSVIGNGLLGAGAATADGLRIRGMLSRGNNTELFNRAPVSGALKIGRSRDVSVIDSAFLDNLGQGPWFDESVYGITFTDNDVIGNTGYGLVLELSEKAVVANNIVADNALAGIAVINTGNTAIWNNTVVGNERNIAIVQDSRRASVITASGHDPRQPLPDPTVPWITRSTVIANNVVSDSSGYCLVCVEDRSKVFTGANMVSISNGNVYARMSRSTPASFAVWSRGSAGAAATYTTLKGFTAATAKDANSVLLEGRSAVDDGYVLQGVSPASVAQAVPKGVAAVSRLSSGARVLGAQPR